MDLIIQQVSESLKISLDKAQELYPIIREQWVWYKILSSITFITFILAAVVGVVMLFIALSSEELEIFYEDEEEARKEIRRFLKNMVIVFSISTVLFLLTNGLKFALAPDLTLMMKFLGR